MRCLSGIEKGIRHLHALGIVHNDLDPANTMITEHDTPFLSIITANLPISQSTMGLEISGDPMGLSLWC